MKTSAKGLLAVTDLMRNPEKILIIFPLSSYNSFSLLPAIEDLRRHFENVPIITIMKKEDMPFFQRRKIFDEHISYEGKIGFLSPTYFRLARELRYIKPSISIDFNNKTAILSRLAKATLRVGTIDSRAINCRIRLPGLLNETERAQEIVKTITHNV